MRQKSYPDHWAVTFKSRAELFLLKIMMTMKTTAASAKPRNNYTAIEILSSTNKTTEPKELLCMLTVRYRARYANSSATVCDVTTLHLHPAVRGKSFSVIFLAGASWRAREEPIRRHHQGVNEKREEACNLSSLGPTPSGPARTPAREARPSPASISRAAMNEVGTYNHFQLLRAILQKETNDAGRREIHGSLTARRTDPSKEGGKTWMRRLEIFRKFIFIYSYMERSLSKSEYGLSFALCEDALNN